MLWFGIGVVLFVALDCLPSEQQEDDDTPTFIMKMKVRVPEEIAKHPQELLIDVLSGFAQYLP